LGLNFNTPRKWWTGLPACLKLEESGNYASAPTINAMMPHRGEVKAIIKCYFQANYWYRGYGRIGDKEKE
jgi:hypothetical protein